jgi:hypothetical protein
MVRPNDYDHTPVAVAERAPRVEDGDASAQVLGGGGHVLPGQREAGEVVALRGHPGFFDALADGVVLNPVAAPAVEDRPVEEFFEDRPERIIVPPVEDKPWLSRKGRKIDFARRDAENRRLGQLGERFAVEVERRRLLSFGRDDLAAKIEWVAVTCGDGTGFDVLSFDESDGSEQYIEVKTTGLGKHFPFYVTSNEVRCSEDCPERFRLYRVFDFSRNPRLFVVTGALSRECRLDPVQYRAEAGPKTVWAHVGSLVKAINAVGTEARPTRSKKAFPVGRASVPAEHHQ